MGREAAEAERSGDRSETKSCLRVREQAGVGPYAARPRAIMEFFLGSLSRTKFGLFP